MRKNLLSSRTLTKVVFSALLPLLFFGAHLIVDAQVCYDNSSTLNSSGYTMNTPLQTTPGFPLSFYNGSLLFSSAGFTGTARWANGVQIQNEGVDYIYLQPDRAPNYLNSANDATYRFTFPNRTTSFSAVFAGLNNNDGTSIAASYQGTPIAITAANFSNLSAGMTLKDSDGNGQMDTVSSTNTAGGTSIDQNTYTLTISVPIDTLIVTSGKDEAGNNSTVTIGIRSFNYCVISPRLSVTKSSNGPWTIGQSNAQYTLNAANAGNKDTSGTITVKDTLPTGITPNWTGALATGSFSCTYSGQNVSCTRTAAIAVSGTAAIVLPVNVTSSVAIGTNSITNYASIGGGGDVYNSGSAPTPGASCTDSAHCAINRTTINAPNLTIAKADTGNFTTGSNGTYQITVGNSGTAATAGTITVSDTLPSGLSVSNGAITTGGTNASNWSCAAAGNVITCTSAAAIATGGSSVFTFPVNVGLGIAVGTNSISNTATVSGGGEPAVNNGNNSGTDQTTVLSPNLTVSKSHTPTAFVKGSTGTYNIVVGNSGTAATAGTITVTDNLPTGLNIADGAVTLSGTNASNWSCTAAGNVITCTSAAAIATGGSSTFGFSVNVASNAAASVTNSVSVSGGSEATANNGDNSATDVTTVSADPPNVTLVKSCSSPADCTTAPQLPGTDLSYKIDFANTGGRSASNLVIVDKVPDNTDYKIGSAVANAGSTGLTFTIDFSSNYDSSNPAAATWTYTPASGSGGASIGFDRNVKAVRWRVTSGSLSNTSPNNAGNVTFTAKIR